MRQSPVDGVLLIASVGDVKEVFDEVDAMRLPVLHIAPMDGRPGIGVSIDDRRAATRAVEHLIELGHRRIGLVKGNPAHDTCAARFHGDRDAPAAAGVALVAEPWQADVDRFAAEDAASASPFAPIVFAGSSSIRP